MAIYHPKICFAFDDQKVWGDSDEVSLEAGPSPNLAGLRVPKHEFGKFAGDYDRKGNLELYWSSPDDPDVVLEGWAVVETRDSLMGCLPGSDVPEVLEKTITLADRRWEFLDWRGGTVFAGMVNQTKPDGMGVFNTAPDLAAAGNTWQSLVFYLKDLLQYESGLDPLATDRVPDALSNQDAKPRDLDWNGAHAYSEIQRLLAEAEATWLVGVDGSYSINMIGAGALPELPGAVLLAGESNFSRSRLGETVVVTSAPARIVMPRQLPFCRDGAAATAAHWEYVAIDTDGSVKPLRDISWLPGADAAAKIAFGQQLVRSGFAGIAGEALNNARQCLFTMIRLLGTEDDPASDYLPILLRGTGTSIDTGVGQARPLPVLVSGSVAACAGNSWSTQSSYLTKFECDLSAGIIRFGHVLGKCESAASSLEEKFQPLADGDLTIQFASECRDNQGGDAPWKDYFVKGYSRDLGGVAQEMTDEALAAALGPGGSNVRVLSSPALLAYGDEEGIANLDVLSKRAKALADRTLAKAGSPRQYRYVGMQPVSPSGAIPRVTWQLKAGLTVFDYQAFYTFHSRFLDGRSAFGEARAATAAAVDQAAAPNRQFLGTTGAVQAQPTLSARSPYEVPALAIRWGKVVACYHTNQVLDGVYVLPCDNVTIHPYDPASDLQDESTTLTIAMPYGPDFGVDDSSAVFAATHYLPPGTKIPYWPAGCKSANGKTCDGLGLAWAIEPPLIFNLVSGKDPPSLWTWLLGGLRLATGSDQVLWLDYFQRCTDPRGRTSGDRNAGTAVWSSYVTVGGSNYPVHHQITQPMP